MGESAIAVNVAFEFNEQQYEVSGAVKLSLGRPITRDGKVMAPIYLDTNELTIIRKSGDADA